MTPQSDDIEQIQAAFLKKIQSMSADDLAALRKLQEFTENLTWYDRNRNINMANINDGALTISKNNVTLGVFTANSPNNVNINIPVPTQTSELTNNSNFVSDANYVHTDNNFNTTEKTALDFLIEHGTVEMYYCETDPWIKNKTARVLANVSPRTPPRKGVFIILFKKLNWYTDGSYNTVSFSDAPNTRYNIIIDNLIGTGSYYAYNSGCFGFGTYLCLINGSNCFITPFDRKMRCVAVYATTPQENEDWFKQNTATDIYQSPYTAQFNKHPYSVPLYMPTCYLNNDTKFHNYNINNGSGWVTGGMFNGVRFGSGTLIDQGEYIGWRGTNYAFRYLESYDWDGVIKYTGSVTTNGTTRVTMFTNSTTLVNKRITIVCMGQVGSHTFVASGIFKSVNTNYSYILQGLQGSASGAVLRYLSVQFQSNGVASIARLSYDTGSDLTLTFTVTVEKGY